jgi:hypothetical protein
MSTAHGAVEARAPDRPRTPVTQAIARAPHLADTSPAGSECAPLAVAQGRSRAPHAGCHRCAATAPARRRP